MSEIKNKNYILATIDQLRARKSRPDIYRICKFMHKFHRVSFKETKADLRRCVNAKFVYKVDYKDNVSYRNAAKCRRNRKVTTVQKKQMNKNNHANDRRILTTAIAELIYHEQSCLERGVTFKELSRAAASQNSLFTRKQLEAIIQRELNAGSLVRLPNGNLALGPADNDDSSQSLKMCDDTADSHLKMSSSANSSCGSPPLRMRGRPGRKRGSGASVSSDRASKAVRVGERRKRAKKVFDPSENNVPSKRKRGRPVGSLNKSTLKRRLMGTEGNSNDVASIARSDSQGSGDMSNEDMQDEDNLAAPDQHDSPPAVGGAAGGGGVCSVCLVARRGSEAERLVECRDCSNKAHASCLRNDVGMLRLRPDNTWQCPHCKTCVVCCETNDAGVLTVCSICADAYHALCHSPRIPERFKAWDQWECSNCMEARPAPLSPPAASPPPSAAPVSHSPYQLPHQLDRPPHLDTGGKESDCVDLSIPDITDWSCGDVYEYFADQFPEAAHVFREQEMDGRALGLARRADIVRGFGLALGPALHLYRLVVRLQTRKDDFTMCWG